MNTYTVWMEGYAATGAYCSAVFVGNIEAESFKAACKKAADSMSEPEFYDEVRNTYWGCRFFDNEGDAREMFG